MDSLDFDSVSLVPRVISSIESRDDVKIRVDLDAKNDIFFSTPIIASPMMDVCDGEVAYKVDLKGGLGVIHRFNTIPEQIAEYEKKYDISSCAIGVEGDSIERFQELFKAGCRLFCIDTANGAHRKVERVIKFISNYDISIMVGNVASKECYKWLEQFEKVKFIRVGIAGGTSCTTKNATGVSRGMISCIQECNSVKMRTLLVADGGIKEPSDMCKAIAFGADMVMLGGVLAAATDSPAGVRNVDGVEYKIYRGSASLDVQKEYRDYPRYIEGKTSLLKQNGETIDQIMTRFKEGLRSSMSYFNAHTLDEYRRNISYVTKS